MMISIVIPTYKRKNSLLRLLKSISKQNYQPQEVLIIAAGYTDQDLKEINQIYPKTTITTSTPSVCKQRNIGIKAATGEYVLLCDDDIELPDNYLQELITYSQKNSAVKIITGAELQQNKEGNWNEVQQKPNFFSLMYAVIFGLGICSDLSFLQSSKNPLKKSIYNRFYKNNNSISKGGWPILTQFSFPVMQTSIYGLGCAMIKQELLVKTLYREDLGPNGIGDNYDVGLKINGTSHKTHVLRNVTYKHHKEIANRHTSHINYFKRCVSLEKFLRDLPFFSFKNRCFFIWSLMGNGFRFFIKFDLNHLRYNQKMLVIAIINMVKH